MTIGERVRQVLAEELEYLESVASPTALVRAQVIRDLLAELGRTGRVVGW